VPINFAVIFFKIFMTKSITPEMRSFPKYKFAVMGLLDSLQGFLIVVGGVQVPGIMQSLLLQGAVPVTMIFSILMLRPRGCDNCKRVRAILKKTGVPFEEAQSLQSCEGSECSCYVTVNGMEVNVENLGESLGNGSFRKVVLTTSAKSWKTHTSTFYQTTQYIGAVIIMGGIVVSMWDSLTKKGASSGGNALYEMIFFLATVPTAVSGVYKEIAFRDQEDMDVWYLNGWVALFQFIFGLTYAPLAATMSGLPIHEIPSNLYGGFLCWLLGRNTITSHCLAVQPCGPPNIRCCDSCDGSLRGISSMPAFWGMSMYMIANIAYNVFLVLVIKYGSAALMYIASTIVLPLGTLSFTIHAFMGDNARKFTPYSGAGLLIILIGLVIYRFLGKKSAEKPNTTPIIVGITEPIFLEQSEENPVYQPRTRVQIRNNYYSRLGFRPELNEEGKKKLQI